MYTGTAEKIRPSAWWKSISGKGGDEMRKKGKFHGSLLSAVMILVILFTALGEKGISAKAGNFRKRRGEGAD